LPLQRGIYLLPNLLTTGGMACGFYSIVRAIHGDFKTAAYFIIVATLFDLVDGRVARITRTTSEFGTQYDSLADLASFGLAPAVLLYRWGLEGFGRVGWIAAFLFFVCGALRLARFNVQSSAGNTKYFMGLPIPIAAATAASTVILDRYLGGEGSIQRLPVLIMVFCLAFLMVSAVPYRSFKDFDLRTQRSFQALVTIVIVVLLILTNPAVMLFICSTSYVMAGVVADGWRHYQRLRGLTRHGAADVENHLMDSSPPEIDPPRE
jgi:CDP-diacylglycerol--serine O-phosphatidyltransferase